MLYVGLDCHKKYTQASAQDEQGKVVLERRIDHAFPDAFARYFSELGQPCKVAFEACLMVDWMAERLDGLPFVEEIVLAHPYKTRLIAETAIKTDTLDARKLGMLLRGDFIARAHLASRTTRLQRSVVRERVFWVRQRTRVRNRLHRILERQKDLRMPVASDVFGAKGKAALRKAILEEPCASQLERGLGMLDALDERVRETDRLVREEVKTSPDAMILLSIPGIGPFLAWLITLEIDGVQRFSRAAKLTCYAGLVPSTSSSGGKTGHGRTLDACNKWLKWAFVEAAWVSVGCSAYFGGIYRRLRDGRRLPAGKAILAVARRMCEIAHALLVERREFQETYHRPAVSISTLPAASV